MSDCSRYFTTAQEVSQRRSNLRISTLIRLSSAWHQRPKPSVDGFHKSNSPLISSSSRKKSNARLDQPEKNKEVKLPKITFSSCLSSQCKKQRQEVVKQVAEKTPFPAPVKRIVINVPSSSDTKQTLLHDQQVKLPFIEKKKLQLRHKPMQPQSSRRQPIKSKSMKQSKSKISSLPKVLVRNNIQRPLWSPESNESWDYVSMKKEVNRVLQDELQSTVSTTAAHEQDDVSRIICNEEQLQEQSTVFQASKCRNCGNESCNYLKLPILITETYSFGVEVNNVVHPFKKRMRRKGKQLIRQTTSKSSKPFIWNGIEFHFRD